MQRPEEAIKALEGFQRTPWVEAGWVRALLPYVAYLEEWKAQALEAARWEAERTAVARYEAAHTMEERGTP